MLKTKEDYAVFAVMIGVIFLILSFYVLSNNSDNCGMDFNCDGTTSSRERRLFNEGFSDWKKRGN